MNILTLLVMIASDSHFIPKCLKVTVAEQECVKFQGVEIGRYTANYCFLGNNTNTFAGKDFQVFYL